MAKIKFDLDADRKYEVGVNECVLYPYNPTTSQYGKGVAWNGIISITETPSGAETTKLYADNINYVNLLSAEEFGGTIEAYTYPDEWAQCDGSTNITTTETGGAIIDTGLRLGQQDRVAFALVYKTKIGNAVNDNLGYKLHVLYGCKASPSERAYETINDSPSAINFSWEFTATPVPVDVEGANYKPTACVVIDSTKANSTKLASLLSTLYGSGETEGTNDPALVMPEDIIEVLS